MTLILNIWFISFLLILVNSSSWYERRDAYNLDDISAGLDDSSKHETGGKVGDEDNRMFFGTHPQKLAQLLDLMTIEASLREKAAACNLRDTCLRWHNAPMILRNKENMQALLYFVAGNKNTFAGAAANGWLRNDCGVLYEKCNTYIRLVTETENDKQSSTTTEQTTKLEHVQKTASSRIDADIDDDSEENSDFEKPSPHIHYTIQNEKDLPDANILRGIMTALQSVTGNKTELKSDDYDEEDENSDDQGAQLAQDVQVTEDSKHAQTGHFDNDNEDGDGQEDQDGGGDDQTDSVS